MSRAHGRIVDGAGVPVTGKVYPYRVADGIPADHCVVVDSSGYPVGQSTFGRVAKVVNDDLGTPRSADAVPDPMRRGYFDFPGGLPDGTYYLHVHPSGDPTQTRWAWPLVVSETPAPAQDIRVGGPRVGSPGGVPDPNLGRQFTPGTFNASVSLYGLLGAPLDRAKRDLSRFRNAGFGNVRTWIDWNYFGVTGSAAVDPDGHFIEPVAAKLDELLAYGQTIGMSLDLTMHAAYYKFRQKSAEGYDIYGHKAAIRAVLQRWGQAPAFRILDMANEAEVRGAGGHGSPDTGHVSPGRFLEMMTVARSVPHKCLVGCSVSGGGDFPGDVPANYAALFRDTKADVLLPHGDRKSGWGARTGALTDALEKRFPGIPVHHQEPARNGHSTQPGMWPLSEFEAAFKTAKASGAVGCCLHGDFGFDMRSKDAWDQRDPIETEVCSRLKSWIA